jgi:hypothetical protein
MREQMQVLGYRSIRVINGGIYIWCRMLFLNNRWADMDYCLN